MFIAPLTAPPTASSMLTSTSLSACLQNDDLPRDAMLCPGDALNAANLHQLLNAALPDKSRHKAAGWFDQTDFLLTRSHVDEDQDAYHNALFITIWKRWDFWLALPQDDAAPARANALTQAWTRLRHRAPPPLVDGLLRQFRSYDSAGQPGDWQPLQEAHAPAQALPACLQAWRQVIGYWRLAEGQRRAGRPLRDQLHATLTPARVQALTLLPIFTARYNDWSNPERNGWWEDEVWIGARQPGQREGRQWGRVLKLSWRNGPDAPGDEEDDAHACYQIDVTGSDAPPEGTAHPPGLRISYSQRQSDARVPLPLHAVPHMARLLGLFIHLEHRLQLAHARDLQALLTDAAMHDMPPPPALPRMPPFAAHETDAEVLGAQIMALSQDWQALGRAHAARMREHWERPPASSMQADEQHTPAPPADPRSAQAVAMLQLARAVHALADADLSGRFHRRFAFAPQAFAHLAARHGRAVDRLQWQADGRLLAHVAAADAGQAGAWWAVSADGWAITPAPAPAPDAAPEPQARSKDLLTAAPGKAADLAAPNTVAHGLNVYGDDQGDLHGMTEDGRAIWRHHVGGAILALAASADGNLLAVGTAGGYLVLLRKGSGTDPHLASTSRYYELRRFIFWRDAPGQLAW